MKNNSTNIIPKIVALLAAGSIFLAIFIYFQKSKKSKIIGFDPKILNQIPEVSAQVQSIWLLGEDFSGEKLVCPELEGKERKFDSEFLRCNSAYVNCALNKRYLLKGSSFVPQKDAKGSFISWNHHEVPYVRFKIKGSDITFSVQLKEKCREVSLPKNIYAAGDQSQTKYIWDNYLQNISIDKHYVTNFDINNWIEINKDKIGLQKFKTKDIDKLAAPSLNLPLLYRKLYCQDRGKTLLQSRVFDAAVFYPVKVKSGYVHRAPYPWKKTRKSFLSVKDSDEGLKEEECDKAFIKGCKERLYFSENSPSWIGIYHALGSEMESFENIFFSKANLKVSSRHLERENQWHKNGLRGHWEGVNFSKRDFDLKEQYSNKVFGNVLKKYEVAFRCMRLE